jgi:hypothetical protein
MATFKDKISQLINSQAPEFVVEQHPKFLEFVKLIIHLWNLPS